MMKTAILILLSTLSLFALEWNTYASALKEQKKTNKLIMIAVASADCHYCKNMDKEVFQNKEMIKWLENRFIPVKLILGSDKLPLGIKVVITPTFYFIDKHEKIVKKVAGSWNIEDFKFITEKLK